MTKEEIVTALLDDMEMPYLQDWQARDIVDFVLKKYTEGLPTIKGWVVRDKDWGISFYDKKPQRYGCIWACEDDCYSTELPDAFFCELSWEDGPCECELTLSKI